MNRRRFLQAAGSLPLLSAAAGGVAAGAQADTVPFDRSSVRQLARDAAGKPYVAPDTKLPDSLKDLDYDHYRQIRFLPDRALWHGDKLPFEVQFFHRGFFYAPRVDIYEVANGQATRIAYRIDDFAFGSNVPPGPGTDLGFAGFRIHAPINRPDYYDEVCVFLGASYFRAVAKGEIYGLSARGLAINTGEAKGEISPVQDVLDREAGRERQFRRRARAARQRSTTAAYRFTIRPGDTTVFDVEMAIYPRVALDHAGLAPMTSMFFFGSNDRTALMIFARRCTIPTAWRSITAAAKNCGVPSAIPRDLQISTFADLNTRGFGLMQRQKIFAYQDIQDRGFEKRPSLWAEPIGDWGEGSEQFDRNSDQGGNPRQHRRLLAAEGSAAGQGRAYLHLSSALGAG